MARTYEWSGEIEAIAFDLDNTLYDRDANVRAWLETIFVEQPGMVEEAVAFDDCGFIPRADFYEWIWRRVDWAETPRDVKLRFQCDILRSIKPDPLISRFVLSLSERFLLGVLTNGETDYQLAKFHSLQLDGCFDPLRVLVTDSIGVHKPEAGAFHALIQALGTPASRILFVGDNPVNDIYGAASLGMRTCWIQLRPEHSCSVTPDLRVRSIFELESVFGG
jgi:putative hydrolase of the HAD superfamily